MKTRLFSIIAIIAIITLGIIACNNGDNNNTTHVHEWGEWVQTKAPTATDEGEETKTCATCGEKETRPIPIAKPETFTVTFHANGGTPEPQKQTIEKGKTVTEPQGVTKANNTLDGWYKEDSFTTKWNFTIDAVTADIDLYAKWEEQQVATSADLTLRDIKITLNYKKKPSDDVPAYVDRIQSRFDSIANGSPYIDLINGLTNRNGNYSINVVYGGASFDGFRATDGQTLDAHDTWLTANATGIVISTNVLANALQAMLALPDPLAVATSEELTLGSVKIALNYQKLPSAPVPVYMDRLQDRFAVISSSSSPNATLLKNNLTNRNGNYSINVVYGNDNYFDGFRAVDGQTIETHDTWLTANATVIISSHIYDGFNAMLALPAVVALMYDEATRTYFLAFVDQRTALSM
jgi:uncharacterized repeat protein (TIGR02543 family)